MTWIDPISDGGSPITSFDVICTSGGGIVVGPQTYPGTATSTGKDGFTGLLAGVPYTCTVAACNAVGQGPPSLASNVIVIAEEEARPPHSPLSSPPPPPPAQWSSSVTVGTGSAANDNFGLSVSVSADGTTAVVGAWGISSFTGAAYVFTKTGNGWSSSATLQATGGAVGDRFGVSVSVSADGTTAVVGASGFSSYTGAAYVFTKLSGTWSSSTLLGTGGTVFAANFGVSVSVSGDGSTAVVGAPGFSPFAGAAYVFTNAGSGWSSITTLQATGGAGGDQLGYSVSVSADGATAVVGARGVSSKAGAAYVFTNSGSGWSSSTLLGTGGAAGDQFGWSVSISADGTTALVGAYQVSSQAGAAYVFTNSGSGWSSSTLLGTGGAAGDQFGVSVSVSADGATAVVGARGVSSNTGAVYVFTRSGNVWRSSTLQATGGAVNDSFGRSVSVSGAGTTAMVGAYGVSSNAGAAYSFLYA